MTAHSRRRGLSRRQRASTWKVNAVVQPAHSSSQGKHQQLNNEEISRWVTLSNNGIHLRQDALCLLEDPGTEAAAAPRRRALWIVGSATTLSSSPVWGALLENARERGVLLQNASIRCSTLMLHAGHLAGKPF